MAAVMVVALQAGPALAEKRPEAPGTRLAAAIGDQAPTLSLSTHGEAWFAAARYSSREAAGVVGRVFRRPRGFLAAGAGFGVVRGLADLGAVDAACGGGFLDIYGTSSDRKCPAIDSIGGIAWSVRSVWNVRPRVGLGFEWFGTANTLRNFDAVAVTVDVRVF